MNRLQAKWDQLNPKAKKYVTIGSCGAALLLLVSMVVSGGDGEDRRTLRRSEQTIESVLTDADPRQAGFDAMVSNIRSLERRNAELTRKVDNLEEGKGAGAQNEKLIQNLEDELEKLRKELDSQREEQVKAIAKLEKAKHEARPEVESPTPVKKATENKLPDAFKWRDKSKSGVDADSYFQNAPVLDLAIAADDAKGTPTPEVKIRTITQEPDVDITEADDGTDEIYIPAGSIVNGALITGLDAPTGNQARKDPFPVLLRIKREAILPNRFRADIRECFIIASGFGDLSSERAYLRGETISCVREDGGVIESTFDAYASGEDGKAGIRGRLVSKQGQLLARSLMAGFLEGVSAAFTPQQVPSLTIRRNGSTSDDYSPVYEQALNEDGLQAAAFGGAGRAMERIADFYLEMAQGIFPVIEVDAGREVDFIMKKGAKLKIK